MSSPSYVNNQELILSCVCYAWGISSGLACVSILWSWFRMDNLPALNDSSWMIIFLTISDLCLGMNSIIEGLHYGSSYPDGLCIFTACLAQFFGLSSFLWSAAISHRSYKQVTEIFLSFSHTHMLTQQGRPDDTLDSHTWSMLRYHLLCWGLPLVSTIIMLATQSAGPTGSHFCWIVTDFEDNESILPLSVAVLLYLIPLVAIEMYQLVMFRFLSRTLKQIPGSGALLRKFTRILAILIGTKTLFLLARSVRMLSPSNSAFSVSVFCIIVAPLQGLADYLVFKDTSSASPRSRAATL